MVVLLLLGACAPPSADSADSGDDSGCAGDACDTAGAPRRTGTVAFDELDARIDAATVGTELGAAVAVGDATGDGVADVFVGARAAGGGAGEGWLFAGPLAGGEVTTAAAVAHLTATSTVQLGTEACLGQDLTGDGVADLVVGSRAWMADPLGGAAFLFPGPVAGEHDEADAITLFGAEEEDLFGIAVSCGADATGDGQPDLLVGARGRDGKAADAGAAYLFAGPVQAGTPDAAMLSLRGEGGDDAAGRAVDLRGDLDGDGLTDVVVGAYRQSAEVRFGGAVYVVYGGATGVRGLVDADVVLRSSEDGASAGRALSAAGDLDGDGRADLAVGLSGVNALTGAVGVVFAPLPATGDLATPDARVDAEVADDNAGFAVLSGVDVDGDGVAELGVGAPGQHGEGQGTLPGEAWLFYGPISGVRGVSEADVHVSATEPGAAVGFALAGGDVTGDGVGDVLVGAPFAGSGLGAVGVWAGGVP